VNACPSKEKTQLKTEELLRMQEGVSHLMLPFSMFARVPGRLAKRRRESAELKALSQYY
jgi:hypothetical protein